MFNMGIGEVILGGVGSGLYGMVFYVGVAVFIGGLMVGRTPEYLGKKIGAAGQAGGRSPSCCRSSWCSRSRRCGGAPRRPGPQANQGPHGFSEIFYAYLSQGNNNGSAFAGLTASTPFYAISGGLHALRPVRALARRAGAGRAAWREKYPPFTPGPSAPTPALRRPADRVIVIIGALTFLPGLALGPIVEHLTKGTCSDVRHTAPQAAPSPGRRPARSAPGRCSIRRSCAGRSSTAS